jgi:hypothetical protein
MVAAIEQHFYQFSRSVAELFDPAVHLERVMQSVFGGEEALGLVAVIEAVPEDVFDLNGGLFLPLSRYQEWKYQRRCNNKEAESFHLEQISVNSPKEGISFLFYNAGFGMLFEF